MKELDLIIPDVNEIGGVAVYQPQAFFVQLAVQDPYGCSCSEPDYSTIRVFQCTGKDVAVDVSPQLVWQLEERTALLP